MLTDEMKCLTEDIVALYEARMSFVNTLVNDTAETIGSFRTEHAEMSKELGEFLAASESTRKDEFHQTMESINARILEIKSGTNTMLKDFGEAHAEMSKELGEFLAASESTRKDEFEDMMSAIATRLSDLRNGTQQFLEACGEDREGMAKAWNEMTIALKDRREQGLKKIKELEETERKRQALIALKEAAFETISNAGSEGIKLAQIGQALEKPWQSLIPIANELLNESKIIKNEDGFYHEA